MSMIIKLESSLGVEALNCIVRGLNWTGTFGAPKLKIIFKFKISFIGMSVTLLQQHIALLRFLSCLYWHCTFNMALNFR